MQRILTILFCLFVLPVNSVIASQSYAVVDGDNGRFLFGQNEHTPLPIASLTKVWTALIVLENSELDEKVHISTAAANAEGSLIYLKAGEIWTVEQLLYGLMLRSGNDAAWALAEHAGGSVEGFVRLMNEKAAYYDLAETHFENPSGLPNDTHVSSAYDMGKMMQIAMHNKKFKQIASTTVYADEKVHWVNKHKLLGSNGAIAGKTGYTKAAGRTLVTYFDMDGKKFSVVTLNASNDWVVHKSLAQEVNSQYDRVTVIQPGTHRIGLEKVKFDREMSLLIRKNELPDVQYFLQIWPDRSRSYFHVYVAGERAASQEVQLK